MEFKRITGDRRLYWQLLLLGDEQPELVSRYLSKGELYALYDPGLVAVAVVCDQGSGICELKNLAVDPAFQKQGYGHRFLEFLTDLYAASFHTMLVGTGGTPRIFRFYERCGFSYSHKIPHFFFDNYDHPIVEDGILLEDMFYLKKDLTQKSS